MEEERKPTATDEKANEKANEKTKKIKKVERWVLSVFLALVLLASGFVAGWFGRWGALGKNKRALLWAIDTAQENYYREVSDDVLYNRLFSTFAFDPYSGYYPSEKYKKVEQEREGNNLDAGFSVWEDEHLLQVYSVKSGSFAAQAGLSEGMYLLKYGTEQDAAKMQSGTAEDYFSFVGSLARGQIYYVLCGAEEKESAATVYTLRNGEEEGAKDAGLGVYRAYDPMRVYQVVGNSASDRAGLKRGMYILRYGTGSNTAEMQTGSYEAFNKFIAGLTSDTFYISCSFDKSGADARPYRIVMERYQASYCSYRDSEASYKFVGENNKKPEFRKMEGALADPLPSLGADTAYIAVSGFTGNAAAEFKECLSTMKARGRKHLILDLRCNGGGYMDVFEEIASCLLKETGSGNQRVAYAKFRSGSVVNYSVSKSTYSDYFASDSRVSILADEYTASASECLIGALIDYKTCAFSDIYLHFNAQKGVARTYGKGIMQTHYSDPKGNVLKLTSAEIFWPKSDKSIHGKGVTAEDGANAVESGLLPDADDSFLQQVVSAVKAKDAAV